MTPPPDRCGCGRQLPKRKLGRPAKYCSPRCRKEAFREKRWNTAGISFPARVVPEAGQNASKRTVNSNTSEAPKANPPSKFSVPLNLLGGGRQWPGAPKLERGLWAYIIDLEVGGVVLRAGKPRRRPHDE
jgi:hypothetical protein